MREKIGAVVLAAGQGKRMHTAVAKQFLALKGKPLICYCLEAFQKSPVEEIIFVTGEREIDYCKTEIVEAYGFTKVKAVICGGRERYHSVYQGLKEFGKDLGAAPDYVLIHDGARPLVSEEVIRRAIQGAVDHQACVVGMPVKDTIKVSDGNGFATGTPDRKKLWQIQTPQGFRFDLLFQAYEEMMIRPELQEGITDDAMVVEKMMAHPVKLVEGDYRNIKVTTPEDLMVAEAFLHGCPGYEKIMKKIEKSC